MPVNEYANDRRIDLTQRRKDAKAQSDEEKAAEGRSPKLGGNSERFGTREASRSALVLWRFGAVQGQGYYQMNEKQLAEAFNRDWNYQPGQHKGNTLAKYARDKIGLRFALKRGRPEKPNSLPPG